jgi:hypothetical protein
MSVTDIRDLLRAKAAARPHTWPSFDVRPTPVYLQAALHEGVPVHALVRALTSAGMTLSDVPGHGVVIHRIGQDPTKPAPVPPGAS